MSHTSLRLPDFPLDNVSVSYADEIASLPGVRSVLVLPDGFTKSKYVTAGYKVTVPSSSVIVSDSDTLYPQFRSRGIGCGMAAIALPVQADDLDEQLTTKMLQALTYGPLYQAAYRLRLPLFPGPVDLSYDEFLSVVSDNGAVPWSELTTQLDRQWFTRRTTRLRYCFGRYFGGNHFFELQAAHTAVPELGLQAGQVVAFYHTGCQGLEAVLSPQLRATYIQQPTYVAATKGESMYETFFTAQSILLRYVTAYRQATKTLVDSVLTEAGLPASTQLVDQGHNQVTNEVNNGQSQLVYRHNAVPITEGTWVAVSGMHNHDSYLVCGGKHTARTHHSIDHGLGHILANDPSPQEIPGELVTLERFGHGIHSRRTTTQVPRQQSQRAQAYLELMQTQQVISTAVALRPLVSMKYTR